MASRRGGSPRFQTASGRTRFSRIGPRRRARGPASASPRRTSSWAPLRCCRNRRGFRYLLSAARTLLDWDRRLRFLIVGGGHLEAALRSEADALKLGSRIVFTGWRQDAAELMTALDVFVMSSLWEAMPMALLEAMAARRAIVVTDVGDNRRTVGQCGRGAIVVPPADADALVRAIAEIVADPALASALQESAYPRVCRPLLRRDDAVGIRTALRTRCRAPRRENRLMIGTYSRIPT